MVQNFEKGSKFKKGYKVLGFGVLGFRITWVSQLNFIFYFRILSDVLFQNGGFALNVLHQDDGASGSSITNVLLRGETKASVSPINGKTCTGHW